MTRWGIIGTGKIAHTFAEALRGTENSVLAAVASRSLEKAEVLAAEFGFEKAYGSYEELAADEAVDIVYIATPMSEHYANSLLCLNAGRNVLCEKSIALNTSQAEEMVALAEEKGLFFMEAMWMKFRPTFLKVKQWIDEGRIGKVEFIKADFNNFIPYDKNDRLFKSECGGGALLDLGVYPLTFATALMGEPKEIITHAHIGRDGVDLSHEITLTYEDGAFAATTSGFEVQNRNNAVVSGDKGSITMGDWFFCSSECTLYDLDSQPVEERVFPPEINGYEYEIREAERCLANGLKESPLCPHSDTLQVMRLMDRCREIWGMKFPQEK
ncbi:Gfo/Idh/MocA family oxidoreductase [Ruminococcus sp.]|uniref:Gfo/Idh/MocA family protein n=1 Tax=Ruminococcus sp. TaxID=41978 RepID=UPI0025D80022|nr:Gfo/Idh/MocA family oxidoreductase [Ruminococcus sp.]MBQ8966898.1 Gfo/Idh/MocA family oxidoreductase [Ruminococcus sp.]